MAVMVNQGQYTMALYQKIYMSQRVQLIIMKRFIILSKIVQLLHSATLLLSRVYNGEGEYRTAL